MKTDKKNIKPSEQGIADLMVNLYSSYQNKLDHETQMSIFELFNGLVSLVHDSSMLDVAHAAMQALLVLHQKENIEKWNPEFHDLIY